MNKKQLAAANLDFDVSSIKGTDGKLIPNLGCAIEIEQWLKNCLSHAGEGTLTEPYLI